MSSHLVLAMIVPCSHPFHQWEMPAASRLALSGERRLPHTDTAARFLKTIYQQEPNKWVARGIMVCLILFFDQADILEHYIGIIRSDTAASAVNLRYHLIYYGDEDQPASLEALER